MSTQLRHLFRFSALWLALGMAASAPAKSLYWPREFNTYPEVSPARSAESANFVVYWGTLAGTDPRTAPAAIRFDPADVLAQLEGIYTTYIGTIRFLDDAQGNLARYKLIVVMNDTWSMSPWAGWAFGGAYDDTIGALWVHPRVVVSPSWGLAHEFAHALQAQAYVDHPGRGFVNYEPAGFFWETHAQFMAEHHYPTILEGTDFIRFFNTAHFHWSSVRHHYGNTLFLRHLEDTFGLDLVSRLWRESIAGQEHPLDTLKRIAGLSQRDLGDHFGAGAMKNVNFDYGNGAEMRRTVAFDLDHDLISRRYTSLVPMAGQPGAYAVPYYMAPQDYGYNTVELRPDSPSATIDLTFWGHPNIPAGGNGFRFGLVALDGTTSRVSPLQVANAAQEVRVTFTMRPAETRLFLVVLASPNLHHSYVWEPGWPKIWRYPWQVRIAGAVPFVDNHEGIQGAPHPNGGGFVAATAQVAPTVYVGPRAQVLGNARASGNVRLEDEATLTWEAVASDDAVVRHAGYVGWTRLTGSAVIEECAMPFADSGGTFVAGGDAEGHGVCDAGCYRQFPHPNNGRGECDRRGCGDPANADVNPPFPDHVFGTQDGPGRVGNTLLMAKAGAMALRLTWGPSCSPDAIDYAIYEGRIGVFTGHASLACSDTGADRSEVVVPAAGDRYYLVVPLDARPSEGSYGSDATGGETVPGSPACAVQVGPSCG